MVMMVLDLLVSPMLPMLLVLVIVIVVVVVVVLFLAVVGFGVSAMDDDYDVYGDN